MELRTYLDILRRRWKLLAAATLIVALVAGITSSLKTPMYSASARVLLRPNDPSEQLTQANQPSRQSADADRYLQGQLDVVESEAVAKVVAEEIRGTDVKSLLKMVNAGQAGTTDIISVTATDPDPALAAKVANAFASAYIENRRLAAVAGLEKATKEIDAKLLELESRISTLDDQIDSELTEQEKSFQNEQAKKRPVTTTIPVTQPDGTVVQQAVTRPPVEEDFTGTEDESLATARYAAAVQYQSLYAQQQNLLVTKSLKKGEAELIASAETPEFPSNPKPKRDAALGGIVGLMLGLGVAFLKEQLDERLRTREDAEAASGLTVLAELPFDEDSEENPDQLSAHVRPSSLMAESLRSLRTSLTFLGVDEPVKRIVVTSSGPTEGKSTVAANLGVVYAQAGLRTVVVSADLRKPRIDTVFGVPTGVIGLTDVIAGFAELGRPTVNGHGPEVISVDPALKAALRPTDIDNLFFLPSGKLPPNPAELLGSQKTADVIEALSQLADMIIIDTPPVLAVTDSSVLAPRVDGVVVVASANQTHKGALGRTVSTLSNSRARMLGIVLNKVEDKGGSGYGYGRYYGKYYRSYYGQTEQKRSFLPWGGRKSAKASASR